MYKVLFVCTGNICRSPTAEGVFRALVDNAQLHHQVYVDSAAMTSEHVGDAPDPRTIIIAKRRGYHLDNLVARKVHIDDFQQFDLILGMDNTHYQGLCHMQPKHAKATVALFLDYANHPTRREVPDPYYGGQKDFELVLDLVEQGSAAVLKKIQEEWKR